MKWYSIAWRGLIVGIADVIPGVSGGTLALLTGIYERFIDALSSLSRIPKQLYDVCRGKTRFREFIDDIDFAFLIPFFAAIAIAILLVSATVPALIASYPAITYSLFIGLILAASYSLLRAELHTTQTTIMLLSGIIVGVVIQLLISQQLSANPFTLLLVGAIAITAMLLPGISGSAVLLVLGLYEPVLSAVHDFNISILGWFGLGAIVGLLVSSRAIAKLLHTHRTLTLSALTGLMLGSLWGPARTVLENEITILVSLAGLIGLVLGVLLLRSHNPILSEQ